MSISRNPTWVLVSLVVLHSGCASLHSVRTPKQGEELASASLQTEIPDNRVADLCEVAGQELELRGHYPEAIAQYERARKLEPSKDHLAVRLARLYDRLDDPDRAQKEFRRALERDAENADLLNDAGYFFYRSGDLPKSEELLQRALEQDPEHRRATLNLALVRGDQEDFDECLQLFSSHLPEEEAFCNFGVVLAKKGKPAEARVAFEKALQANANYRPARRFLEHIGEQDVVTVSERPGE